MKMPNVLTLHCLLQAAPQQNRADNEAMMQETQPLVMAIAHKRLPYWGVQFHPESIATGWGAELMSNFQRLCEAHRAMQNVGDESNPAKETQRSPSPGESKPDQLAYVCTRTMLITVQHASCLFSPP